MTTRKYSSTAVATTLTNGITSGATSIVVSAVTGWPGTYPYTIIIDENTSSEEVATVTSASGTTLTVTRGEDGTSAVAHDAAAAVRHGVSARDFSETATHIDATSGVHGATGTIVGTTDTQVLTNKTLTQPTLTLKQSSGPTPTGEGDIQWDTDDNWILVGDGASAKTFKPQPTSVFYAQHYSSIQAAITAASAGDVVVVTEDTTITAAITISKALTLMSPNGAVITQTTAATPGVTITASNVTVEGLKFVGESGGTYGSSGRAIQAYGSAYNSYLTNIVVRNCKITTWSEYGVYLKFVSDFDISGNYITDVVYAGVMGLSAIRGTVGGNTVTEIGPGTSSNAYGISFTREALADLTTAPMSTDIAIAGNVVDGVSIWTGIDLHGGYRITITGNTVLNCPLGIMVGGSNNNGAVETWGPKWVTISGNSVDSELTDGSGLYGISVSGPSADPATAVTVTGNSVRHYGDADVYTVGAINAAYTIGLAISGNSVEQPGSCGICLTISNDGYSVVGNTIVDCWANGAPGEAVGVRITGSGQSGILADNSFLITGAKSGATYNFTVGVRVDSTTSMDTQFGPNYFDASIGSKIAGSGDGPANSTSNFITRVTTPTSTGVRAGLNVPHGTAPSSPVNGDIWTTTAGLYVRINGSTVGPLS